ncbi:MAG: NHLP bacteriocin system secretion protein [Treponema sp.]|nr:NHLP bacteriocin system secretion protein [Treponema sp.]
MFRQSALNRLSSPEQLDQTITVIRPSGWVVLCTVGVLLMAAIVWGVAGSISEKVAGSGVLVSSSRLISVYSSSGGIVKDVFLSNGDEVRKGQIIARIERQDLLEQIQLATQRLANLQQNYDSTARLTSRSTGLTDEMLAKSKSDLRGQIVSLDTQIEDARRKEANMRGLYDDGLVTESVYMASRGELLSFERQKQEIEQKLMDIEVSQVKTTGEAGQKLLALQQQIDEARTQLAIQQEMYQSSTRIVSPLSGRMYEVSIVQGSYVSPSASIAVIEPFSSDGSSLEAVMYFSIQDGKRIKRGMNISVSPSTARQEEYGFIQGIVTAVSDFPVSREYLDSTLQNKGLAEQFFRSGSPIEVKVGLIPDNATKSGFRWSSSKGPDTTLDVGVFCTGSVTVRSQRPIELVIPLIKKNLLGIGEQKTVGARK